MHDDYGDSFFLSKEHKIDTEIQKNAQGQVLIIGNFDGVHLGHQALIAYAKKIAKEKHKKCVMLTFSPHPRYFFDRATKPFSLQSDDIKCYFAKQYGVDFFYVKNFDQQFSMLSAHDFIEQVIIGEYKASAVVVGEDFCFGKNRQGNGNILKNSQCADIHQFTLHKKNNITCSSSCIRQFLQEGNVEKASEMLGHSFIIDGLVEKEKQLARQLGFPTANISLARYIQPKLGVYAVKVYIENCAFTGIANIGLRPTFHNDLQAKCEVHIFDFDRDIYNQKIHVGLIKFIRDEKKFTTIEALKKQINIDVNKVKSIFYK